MTLFKMNNIDKAMPATEATLEDLSQDLMKEISIKNKLLSAQLQEYKLIVKKMENKIAELNMCIGDLKN